MKIEITELLPIDRRLRDLAPIGSIHEVVRIKEDGWPRLYFIELGGEEVGVYSRECRVVKP